MLNRKACARRVAVRLVLIGGLIGATPPELAVADKAGAESLEAAATAGITAARHEAAADTSAFETAAWVDIDTAGIDTRVLAMALRAAATAVRKGLADAPDTLTVIDFSRPSTEKRLWVFDLRSRKLLFEELVSHGRGSGRTLATAFSNDPESHRSSLGLFRTAETYIGKHGYSLRLDGLERGINDKARERAIVMHGAEYVNAAAAKAQGYLGRSLGCPALRPEVTRQLIDTVKGGGLLFAYYPSSDWMSTSEYLNAEAQ